jgi:hypothetical protein
MKNNKLKKFYAILLILPFVTICSIAFIGVAGFFGYFVFVGFIGAFLFMVHGILALTGRKWSD